MKDILKNIIPNIPIYILLFFLFFGKTDDISKKELIKQLNQRDSIISKVVDAQGRLAIEHTNREFTPYVIKTSQREDFVNLRKDLASLGVKVDNLQSAYKISTESNDSIEVKIVRDTIYKDLYHFMDSTKHLSIDGSVDISKNSLEFDYTYRANYDIYSYKYKQGLFKRPVMRLKIVSDDPNVDLSAQTFSVKPPQELFSIGVGVGGALCYRRGRVQVAPAITLGVYKSIYTFRTKN